MGSRLGGSGSVGRRNPARRRVRGRGRSSGSRGKQCRMKALRSPAVEVDGLALEGGHLPLDFGVQYPVQKCEQGLLFRIRASAELTDGPKGGFGFLGARGERIQECLKSGGLGGGPKRGQYPFFEPVEGEGAKVEEGIPKMGQDVLGEIRDDRVPYLALRSPSVRAEGCLNEGKPCLRLSAPKGGHLNPNRWKGGDSRAKVLLGALRGRNRLGRGRGRISMLHGILHRGARENKLTRG